MKVHRRAALGVLGTLGATAWPSRSSQAQLPPAIPPTPRVPYASAVHGRMTGAKAAVQALCAEGVPCVFGVPGAQNNDFWDALKGHGVPYLLVSHEGSASVMADASARATGRVGVFSVVPGPGLTNAMTGIGEALHDSIPVVGLVTDILRGPNAPVGQVHGLANAALMRPVCKAVFEVTHQSQIPGVIHQAHLIARSRRAGTGGRGDSLQLLHGSLGL